MDIEIRPVQESDFHQLIDLFQEFAAFEKLPEKMTNTVEKMIAEQEQYITHFTFKSTLLCH